MRLRTLVSILAIGLSGSLSFAQSPAAPVDPKALPPVVARINGQEIKKEDLLTRVEAVRAEQARLGMPGQAESKEFYRDILEQIVGATLLFQESLAQGVAAADTDVETRLSAIRARFPEEKAFTDALAAQGLTPERLRSELKLNLSVQKLVEKHIAPSVAVSDAAQKKFYDENMEQMKEPERVRVSHILVRADAKTTPEDKAKARAKLDGIVARLKKGEDFAALAKENSDDPGSKGQGGELPWLSPGETVPAFEKAAFALKPNELSDVVETPFGFHVIKLADRKPSGPVPFEQAKPRISDYLTQQQIQEKVRERVEQLKAKAKIEVLI